MIFASNIFSAQLGQADEFTSVMGNILKVMLEHDIQAGIKVSVSGTSSTEVFINSVFPDMSTFANATAKLRQSQKWVDAYMSIGNSKATVPVESFVAEVMEGFDDAPSLSEGVIMVNMWKPNPGRLADLKTGMRIAKEMHMKHGASAVRAYQVYGGRFTGCYGYNVSFTKSFPDHYNYNYQDVNNLILTATKQNLELITTEKDYVKINNKNKIIHVLSIEMHLNVEDKSKLKLFLMEKINAESFSLLH